MPVIGITGGVGTGKSSFLRALLAQAPAESFDADLCVHQLLAGDADLLAAIRARFGASVFSAPGALDRSALREIVFADDAARRALEALIHPAVRERWQARARACRGPGPPLYLDIPLLYETGAEKECDRVVVVACAPAVQRERLAVNRGLAPALIERMIEAQLDLAAKVFRADHVVWNDGSAAALDEQARLFAAYLRETYG